MAIDAIITGLVFITIHLLANNILPVARVRQLKWLSFSGGVACAYVFVYILPALHEEQQDFGAQTTEEFVMESELYFFGLLGLLMFYGMQKAVDARNEKQGEKGKSGSFFWVQVIFFSIYNFMIAYIVIATEVEGIQAVFYSTAIGLHFMAIAHDLWREDKERYNRTGRFVLAGGIIAGWIMGMMVTLSSFVLSIIFAFVSGAIILNVLKNELPSERNAHFPTFALGAMSYTLFVMGIKFFFEW
ncbi:hypothetical protein ACFPU1_07390 [Thalassorhabdus alkalitolerans]|uniref:Zinc transporter, ZIP family n=1 Tax=Thalassorhabdus alkalitolerans TaxID=2282697 RepID=A0ABW0YJP0_9BACI|nr:hypothetical protein [Thalassobacillus sp. C254]